MIVVKKKKHKRKKNPGGTIFCKLIHLDLEIDSNFEGVCEVLEQSPIKLHTGAGFPLRGESYANDFKTIVNS